ncbi:hypothetical protein CFOLD11_38840 [Clostridium folliculivorans]|uniref:Uncharacterized protein n=1 Tax=Clostridium folliculivorans TaxID=2886038 RepID=A0A9W5Y5Z6_9CLOT|nr:hypothetical protein [Clostridium folliculivorans]GKU27057.1 hypothetical protein CFOLD11_38840 [Clostridium folliculivorans]
MGELKLYRCTIIGENDKYFIGKDVLDNKLLIAKNNNTRRYKIGTNDSFYASIKKEGLLVKKDILYPISSAEYEELASNNGVHSIDDEIIEKLKRI